MVAPVFHAYVGVAALVVAVNTTAALPVPLAQRAPELTDADGIGFTVTVPEAEFEQPVVPFVTVTVYPVVEAGETEIEAVVAPLLHAYVGVAALVVAVNVTAALPVPLAQRATEFTVTVGIGLTVTVPTPGADGQPLPFVTVTVYPCVEAGDTEIEEVVAPLLHKKVLFVEAGTAVAVNVTAALLVPLTQRAPEFTVTVGIPPKEPPIKSSREAVID